MSGRGVPAVALWLGLFLTCLVSAPPAPRQGFGQPFTGLPAVGQTNPFYDTVTIGPGMFPEFVPRIPILRFGYLWTVGESLRAGRVIGDYVVPIRTGPASTFFGQAHAEYQSFGRTPSVSLRTFDNLSVPVTPARERVDLSFGGGYRTMVGRDLFLGVEGFYDTARLFDRWYSSGGFGLQAAANTFGSGAFDLKFNW